MHEPPPPPAIEGQLLDRATRIARVLARFGLDARRTDSNAERAQLLRGALEELGPTFAKLGQILSTRPDLVPPEVVEELARAAGQRRAAHARRRSSRVMEQELRVPWEDVFASIEPKPLAAGTIGQVHRATLETGEKVVVKVQRPNAERRSCATSGCSLAGIRETPRERHPGVVQHLSESLRRYGRDHESAGRAYGGRASMSRLLVRVRRGAASRGQSDSPERREAARQLLEAFYRQLLADGFFHADPHPGNLLWSRPKGRSICSTSAWSASSAPSCAS